NLTLRASSPRLGGLARTRATRMISAMDRVAEADGVARAEDVCQLVDDCAALIHAVRAQQRCPSEPRGALPIAQQVDARLGELRPRFLATASQLPECSDGSPCFPRTAPAVRTRRRHPGAGS